ncbi:MAG: DNA replication/repair protein RecF [Aggregatilineales bacterium]
MPFVRIAGDVTSGKPGATRTQLDITLMREQLDAEARLKKTIRVNGVPRRALDLIGAMNVVLFVPQDLALIEGSPSDRRRYLNVTLSQTDASYARALHTFDRALEQRNALLRRIQDRQAKPAELEYWDDLFSTAGGGIVAGRQRLLRELEGTAQRVHRELTDDAETLDLRYIPGFVPAADTNGQLSFEVPGLDLHRQLEPRRIADQLCEVLRNGRGAEIARGITLIGPQRDELRFRVNGRDLGLYGSRGQARTAVLALKLAELEWMRGVIGEWPILLLDEFLAELDSARRAYLLARIDGAAQVILTTTEPDIFTPEFLRKSTLWHVRAGQIV